MHELCLDDNDGRVTGVISSEGKFDAPNVLVAAGPNTPDTLAAITGFDGFASRFPIHHAPGFLLETPPLVDRRPVRHILYEGGERSLHIRPSANGGLLIGSDQFDGEIMLDSSPASLDRCAEKLVSAVCGLLKIDNFTIDWRQCNYGISIRSVPNDGESGNGPAMDSPGLFIACTHSGVTLSLVLGELLADTIQSGQVPDQLRPFLFDRFNTN